MALVDKPAGPTSHDCVVRARRALGLQRVGHLGTLDPFASGLLVLVVGAATRLARLAARWPKTYEGVMRLGAVTETDDVTGAPTAVSDGWRTLEASEVSAALAALEGSHEQVPPAYSAKKVAGERAYRLARRGAPVELAPVAVTVDRCALVGWDPPDVRFRARVSSGTYVRALARSVGERLGCGAHLARLRRTEVGPFRVSDALAVEELTPGALLPVEPLARGWPRRDLTGTEWAALRHGRPVPDGEPQEVVTLFVDGRLHGIGATEDGVLHPRVILADQ